MTTTQHLFLPSAACRVAVHVDGPADGPVVLLAHAILSSSVLWHRQAEWLAAEGWRVLRPDTRGHGRSEAPSPPSLPWRMGDLARDVAEILDALDIRAAHYVGLSLGGMCGFALAELHPERLASLCLCDCRADAPAAFARPWDERIALVEAQGCEALAGPTIERWLGRGFIEAHPAEARALHAAAAGTSRAGMVGCARAIQQLDHRAAARGIRVPTTLLVGANDAALPDAMRELRTEIPGAHLEIVPDAGHLPNIDQPERFDAALRAHLERARRTA
jgi:3-oxoadipate enol-lactonase